MRSAGKTLGDDCRDSVARRETPDAMRFLRHDGRRFRCLCKGEGMCTYKGEGMCICMGEGMCMCMGEGMCMCKGEGTCMCKGEG